MDFVEAIVIGAGAIGLAIARRLALDGREVVILERELEIGAHTSSRNNEVIHAGLYHRPGGPQAVLCRRGSEALYAYCPGHGVAHREVGKLVVATEPESLPWLEELAETARLNGVPGVELIDGRAAAALEPNLRCLAALSSPRSGIVDTHGLMLAYLGEAEERGAALALGSRVRQIRLEERRFALEVELAGGETMSLACSTLINAAGIWAPEVARAIAGLDPRLVPEIHLAWGGFFAFAGKTPFTRLVVPEPRNWRQGGIFTLDLAGRGKFGPDEHWVSEVDYDMSRAATDHVYSAVRSYFPALPDGSLRADYAGIRPRLNGPGEPPADWLFQGPAEHGIPGLVNLFGFESPGITASLPIAEAVAGLLEGKPLPFAVDPTRFGRYTPPAAA